MNRVVVRWLAVAATVLCAGLSVGVLPVAATAAPRQVAAAPAPVREGDAQRPSAVKVTGSGLDGDVVIQDKARPEVFQALLAQVAWADRLAPQTGAPPEDKLGPKYTLTVLAQDTPRQVFDLYPLAAGGPRLFRPEQQPVGKAEAGWFYGRLTMSEALRVSGAPLPLQDGEMTGGVGGGSSRIDAGGPPQLAPPAVDVQQVVTDFRRLFLLNGAVALAIALGLAGMSWLIRRKI